LKKQSFPTVVFKWDLLGKRSCLDLSVYRHCTDAWFHGYGNWYDQAFDRIEAVGDLSPSVVAGGIKVALLTTVFGLIVAIILQIFYNYIVSRSTVSSTRWKMLLSRWWISWLTYSAASGEATGAVAEAADKAGGLTAGNLKFISGSITTAIILVALAAASFVLSEIRNIFK
jgi:hypothetical protein